MKVFALQLTSLFLCTFFA